MENETTVQLTEAQLKKIEHDILSSRGKKGGAKKWENMSDEKRKEHIENMIRARSKNGVQQQ